MLHLSIECVQEKGSKQAYIYNCIFNQQSIHHKFTISNAIDIESFESFSKC